MKISSLLLFFVSFKERATTRAPPHDWWALYLAATWTIWKRKNKSLFIARENLYVWTARKTSANLLMHCWVETKRKLLKWALCKTNLLLSIIVCSVLPFPTLRSRSTLWRNLSLVSYSRRRRYYLNLKKKSNQQQYTNDNKLQDQLSCSTAGKYSRYYCVERTPA